MEVPELDIIHEYYHDMPCKETYIISKVHCKHSTYIFDDICTKLALDF